MPLLYFLFLYIFFVSLYTLFFAIVGRFFYKPRKYPAQPYISPFKSCVLIPAYKEDKVIVETAYRALIQSLSKEKYDVYVIADSLKRETLQQLQQLPIQIIEVKFEVSSKAKALNYANKQLTGYKSVVILDADNIMDYYFLERILCAISEGYVAVQGHRVAKNTNTSIAILDAISEEFNNHILRKGHWATGFSSSLIGSAMAFDFAFFKERMAQICSNGEDKELELKILQEGRRIAYLHDALVYDEKAQTVEVYKNQRTRWIGAQIECTQKYFLNSLYQLITKANIGFFDRILQNLFPPRIVFLGLMSIAMMISLFSQEPLLMNSISASIIMYMVAFFLSIPSSLLYKISYKEVVKLPLLFLSFLLVFKNIKASKNRFIHTPHGEIP